MPLRLKPPISGLVSRVVLEISVLTEVPLYSSSTVRRTTTALFSIGRYVGDSRYCSGISNSDNRVLFLAPTPAVLIYTPRVMVQTPLSVCQIRDEKQRKNTWELEKATNRTDLQYPFVCVHAGSVPRVYAEPT